MLEKEVICDEGGRDTGGTDGNSDDLTAGHVNQVGKKTPIFQSQFQALRKSVKTSIHDGFQHSKGLILIKEIFSSHLSLMRDRLRGFLAWLSPQKTQMKTTR